MKRGGVITVLFILAAFIFLASGVLAASPAGGTCSIVPRAECVASQDQHILIGVSDYTNAHGEFPDMGTYNYVLCCAFGEGNQTCTGTNTVIKLSSLTNAHAESSSQSNYNTVKVCYEDLQCTDFQNSCPTNYPKGILSLSGATNGHIGSIDDYPVKICCGSPTFAGCKINSAQWNVDQAIAGQSVHMLITGNSACSGKTVLLKVYRSDGDATSIISQPMNVPFLGAEADGAWAAEYQHLAACGALGIVAGDCSYYFNVSLVQNQLVSFVTKGNSNSEIPFMKVNAVSDSLCMDITSCDGYTTQTDCTSDATLCNVANASSIPGVDCSNSSIICGCTWNNDTGICGFGYNEITECGNATSGCNYGCTLCQNSTGAYCNVGTCPAGEIPPSNNNSVCDKGEGCLSRDCKDGDIDTCANPYYCSFGKCSTVQLLSANNTFSLGNCKISQTIDKTCDEEPAGYKIISWTGIWTENGLDTTNASGCGDKAPCVKCVTGGKSTVQCPAQVQLPFSNTLGLIITIAVIALIYFLLVHKKKSGKAIRAKKPAKRKTIKRKKR